MKILFVVNFDWFFITHRLPLAIESLKKGYEVHLACGLTNYNHKEYLKNLGIKVHELHLSRSGRSINREIKAFSEINKVLKIIDPNIVHFVSIKPILYGGIASRFIKLPKKVFSLSGLGFVFTDYGYKASLFRLLIKIMYKFALGGKNTHVIVQNPDDKAFVKSIVNAPITLIKGSGVDLKKYKYIEEENKNLKVCMASRLLKDKGVFEFIEASKNLKKKFPEATFELYGEIDPPNPASLNTRDLEKIKEDGSVNVCGYENNIAKVFSDANIIVLPSYREGFPKVLMEAAACGRSVVTSDVPGCRDAIKNNVSGFLCKVKDADSLSQMIEKLLSDQGLRNKMGEAGRKLAQQEFDIKKVVNKHFEIYHID